MTDAAAARARVRARALRRVEHARLAALAGADSRAATEALLSGLRAQGFGPRALGRFVYDATRRSMLEARKRPVAVAEATAIHLAIGALAHPRGRAWLLTSWIMTVTHLGMLEQRRTLGAPNLLTVARAALPAAAHRLGAAVPVLALASDFVDGKLARRTGRPRVLAFESGFHGRTMGSLALTGKAALREPFEPLVPGVEHLPTELDALEAAMGADVAAVILEPIKGEAGVVPLPPGFLAAARELTTAHGALLILDEIQTGAGRTGDWFAFQHAGELPEGVLPDAIALAKGIGGGVPIGALVTTGAASELFTLGQHGSTFGGNPLATGVADAVLAEIERADLVANAARRGEQLRSGILALGSDLIVEVRGRGLLLGIELAEPIAPAVVGHALQRGLIVNATGPTTVRLAPPLIIGDAEIDRFLTVFAASLEAARP